MNKLSNNKPSWCQRWMRKRIQKRIQKKLDLSPQQADELMPLLIRLRETKRRPDTEQIALLKAVLVDDNFEQQPLDDWLDRQLQTHQDNLQQGLSDLSQFIAKLGTEQRQKLAEVLSNRACCRRPSCRC